MKTQKTNPRYYIRAEYFYYYNTLGAPVDGALRDYDGNRLEFASREEAEAYLCDGDTEYAEHNCEKNTDGSYSRQGVYVTSHGEYQRPSYRIRKVRGAR